MKIIFDTQTKQFTISPSDEAKDLKGISDELCHNLVRIIQRPNHSSVNHWIYKGIYGFLLKPLMQSSTISRRPIEYMFNNIGNYMNNSKKFYLVKEEVQSYNEIVLNETSYGTSLELEDSIVAYGLWIFYKLFIPPKRHYFGSQLKDILDKWLSIISEGFWEWETLSGIKRSSLRYYPGSKKFLFKLNY